MFKTLSFLFILVTIYTMQRKNINSLKCKLVKKKVFQNLEFPKINNKKSVIYSIILGLFELYGYNL